MKKLLLILFCITYLSSVYATDQVTIKLRIVTYKGNADGLRVELYCNSLKETSLRVGKTGKCNVNLKFNKDYRLAIVKDGYVTKYIDVNTDIPASVLENDSKFPPMKLDVKLFPYKKDVDISIFKQPVQKMYYDNILDDLVFDKDYAYLIKDRIKKAENLLINTPVNKHSSDTSSFRPTLARLTEKEKKEIEARINKDLLTAAAQSQIINKPTSSNIDIEQKLKNSNNKVKTNQKSSAKVAQGTKDISAGDVKIKPIASNKELTTKKGQFQKKSNLKAVSVVGMIAGMRVVADATNREGEEISFEEQQERIRKALGVPIVKKEVNSIVVPKEEAVAEVVSKIPVQPVKAEVLTEMEKPAVKKMAEKKTVEPEAIKTKPKAKPTKYELLNERDRVKLDNNYNMLISKGDAAFGVGNFAIAKFFYKQAKQLKSFEIYPVNKLEEIQSIIMDSKYQELKKKFKELVNKADGYFKKNSYVVARFYYERARDIWSWDTHVKERLKDIEAKIGK